MVIYLTFFGYSERSDGTISQVTRKTWTQMVAFISITTRKRVGVREKGDPINTPIQVKTLPWKVRVWDENVNETIKILLPLSHQLAVP